LYRGSGWSSVPLAPSSSPPRTPLTVPREDQSKATDVHCFGPVGWQCGEPPAAMSTSGSCPSLFMSGAHAPRGKRSSCRSRHPWCRGYSGRGARRSRLQSKRFERRCTPGSKTPLWRGDAFEPQPAHDDHQGDRENARLESGHRDVSSALPHFRTAPELVIAAALTLAHFSGRRRRAAVPTGSEMAISGTKRSRMYGSLIWVL
jgi:hypothetical protein